MDQKQTSSFRIAMFKQCPFFKLVFVPWFQFLKYFAPMFCRFFSDTEPWWKLDPWVMKDFIRSGVGICLFSSSIRFPINTYLKWTWDDLGITRVLLTRLRWLLNFRSKTRVFILWWWDYHPYPPYPYQNAIVLMVKILSPRILKPCQYHLRGGLEGGA